MLDSAIIKRFIIETTVFAVMLFALSSIKKADLAAMALFMIGLFGTAVLVAASPSQRNCSVNLNRGANLFSFSALAMAASVYLIDSQIKLAILMLACLAFIIGFVLIIPSGEDRQKWGWGKIFLVLDYLSFLALFAVVFISIRWLFSRADT